MPPGAATRPVHAARAAREGLSDIDRENAIAQGAESARRVARTEHGDHGGADRGGQMARAAVIAQQRAATFEDRGEFGRTRAARDVDHSVPCAGAYPLTQIALPGRAHKHDGNTLRRSPAGQLGEASLRPAFGGPHGARSDRDEIARWVYAVLGE